jgi:putative membrane protein
MRMLVFAAGQWNGWGHMWGGGWGWGLIMMLFWTGLIALVAWLVVRTVSGTRTPPAERTGLDRARDVLADRYARGEISTEEYKERLTHLGPGR